jgi:dTDP-4-amino-4,6-dideoxygalactose transaminase
MLRFGQPEITAFAQVALSGQLFRYHAGGQCARFEQRFAKALGVPHALLTSSGSTALTAALAGFGVGPGDEVLVPAHTYMATALAVLAVGAIPVLVEIDEALMLDPVALADAIGPRTRAVIPVHMWGGLCDMDAIMRVADKHQVLIIEDACQCVGGSYRGRMAGAIGHAGAYSFNFYKNITAGEGGAVVTHDALVAKRAGCMVDCCSYYWTGRQEDFQPFAAAGSRASEFDGAILNVQLDRLPGMLKALRRMKGRILEKTADLGLLPVPCHSPEGECATTVLFRFETAAQADDFATRVGGTVAGKTGRHTYTEWDPILEHRGAHHPALNPFTLPQNKDCRMTYSKTMCPRSLELLARTVIVHLHPDKSTRDVTTLIRTIRGAAEAVLG